MTGENLIHINGEITINVDMSVKNSVCEKNYAWNLATFNCENGKYVASITDEIICDEIIDVEETNFNKKI